MLTRIVEEFSVGDKRHKVIGVNREEITYEGQADDHFANELLRYIAGSSKMDDYDNNADYCVSFDGVQIISSSALGGIASMNKRHSIIRQTPLSVAGLNPALTEIFRTTKMDGIVTVYDDVAAYKKAVGYTTTE